MDSAVVTPLTLIGVCLACLLLGSVAFLPYCCSLGRQKLQMAEAASVGLFATMALTHLLVEAQEYLELQEHEHEHDATVPCKGHSHAFPIATTICVATLLLLLAIEELSAHFLFRQRRRRRRRAADDKGSDCDDADVESGEEATLDTKATPTTTVTTAASDSAHVCLESEALLLHATSNKERLSNFVLFNALSLHSMIAGAALGVESCFFAFLTTAIAILAHKGVEALALGAAYKKSRTSLRSAALPIVVFSLAVPIGALLGYMLRLTAAAGVREVISGVSLAMAAGAFLFVSLIETLPKVKDLAPVIRLPMIALGAVLGIALTQTPQITELFQ